RRQQRESAASVPRARQGLRCAVADANVPERVRVDALYAGDVEAEERRIAAPLVVRIDAAHLAEIVFRLLCVPLIERELVGALDHAQAVDRHGGHDRAPAAAQRAITAPQVLQTVGQFELECDGSAMASAAPDTDHRPLLWPFSVASSALQ